MPRYKLRMVMSPLCERLENFSAGVDPFQNLLSYVSYSTTVMCLSCLVVYAFSVNTIKDQAASTVIKHSSLFPGPRVCCLFHQTGCCVFFLQGFSSYLPWRDVYLWICSELNCAWRNQPQLPGSHIQFTLQQRFYSFPHEPQKCDLSTCTNFTCP